jgi:hypothetical protein
MTKGKRYRPWTSEEDKLLIMYKSQGRSYIEMERLMKLQGFTRTADGIGARWLKLGLKVEKQKREVCEAEMIASHRPWIRT